MRSNTVAIIPVREGSQRVKMKNFVPFHEELSLLQVKINQLKSQKNVNQILVSSDSELAKKIAKENNVGFILRDPEMCNSTTPWSDVVEHILNKIPDNPIVVWALTTAPLFSRFDEAIEKYQKCIDVFDSLVGVLPKKTFYLNKIGKGINFNPGPWHPYSQDLDTYYEITGSVFIGKKDVLLNYKYWFGRSPFLFELSNLESVDVDTNDDFEIAKELFKLKV